MNESPALSKNRKRKKSKPPSPMVERLSAIGAFTLKYSFSILMTLLVVVVSLIFYHRYYHTNAQYTTTPADITLQGNSVLQNEQLLEWFNLNRELNGFEIVRSDIVERLQSENPIVKDVKMEFRPPKTLEIWVEERTPIARLARPTSPDEYWPPLAVDDEGVVFRYPKSLQAYPEVGSREFAKHAEPGQRLPATQQCMLHLLEAAEDILLTSDKGERTSGVARVTLLSADPEDGLRVTLHDGREIKIAWPNMSTETEISEAMVKRLQRVAIVMRDPATVGLMHFNAMAEDRVAGSE